MADQEFKHQRRPRYKGTHPVKYETKYKELNPEKYADTVIKVMQKGSTPAGMHRPICVKEIIDFLQIKPGQIGLDATLGYGGHTLEMLKCLNNIGHLYAIDVDPIELPNTKNRLLNLGYDDSILTIQNLNFSNIDQIIALPNPFNFILADLGISSMQIDNPKRGFSFKNDGPLDLRMNPLVGIPANYRLKKMTLEQIEGMLIDNSDEPHAKKIAEAIINEYKKGGNISTTLQLQNVITSALNSISFINKEEEIKKSCQRTFQALRIDVNHEFEALYEFLEKIPSLLASNGRVAILTFHSGEDRLVKKSFQRYYKEGVYQDISLEPIRPSMEEQSSNSRSRSAKLRWAIKV